jgi:hypothetical protein
MKELSKLFVAQHSGYKNRCIASSQCGIGHVRRIAKPQQEPGEVANDSDTVLLSARTFVRFLG